MMKKEKSSNVNNTKLNILNAAKSILLSKGIGSLTVDAACAKANLSKGAFFYYFKTKDDLLKELLLHLIEHQKELYLKFYNEDELEFGKGLRAYIRTTLSLTGTKRQEARAICRCMMEMLFSNSDLLIDFGLKPGYYQGLLQEPVIGGMSTEQARLILLACEGLWYDQSLEVNGVHPDQVNSVIHLLIELTKKKLEINL